MGSSIWLDPFDVQYNSEVYIVNGTAIIHSSVLQQNKEKKIITVFISSYGLVW